MKLYIVHAFTEKIFGGNPAGIVLLDPYEEFPSKELAIKIAGDLRYSETVFIKKCEKDKVTFILRYFTPTDEVSLCGHATIGAFQALLEEDWINDTGTYFIETKEGRLPIEMEKGFVWMTMAPPKIIPKDFSEKERNDLYMIMGLKAPDNYFNPLIVSTGLADIIFPVKNPDDLNSIKADMKALSDISRKYEVTGLHAFTLGHDDITCHTRNFAPLYGIDEEAATGTASGALTYYLYNQGLIRPGETYTYLQGEAMGRPSKILARLQKSDGFDGNGENAGDEGLIGNNILIKVGGRGVVFAKGNLDFDY